MEKSPNLSGLQYECEISLKSKYFFKQILFITTDKNTHRPMILSARDEGQT